MDLSVIISLPVIAVFGFMGFKDGVIKRIIEIAGVLVTLLLTARFASEVNPWMMDKTGWEEGPALVLTWAGLFFAGLVLSRLLAVLVTKLVNLTVLGWVNRLGGFVVGVALGTLVASVLLQAVSHVPGGQDVVAEYQKSSVGKVIYYAAPTLYQAVSGLGGGDGDEVWDRVMDATRDAAESGKEKADEALEKAKEKAKEEAEEAARDALGG